MERWWARQMLVPSWEVWTKSWWAHALVLLSGLIEQKDFQREWKRYT
jgi:hypothetical protein